eukprot:m.630532 g.630532  ORF g.630532 m.630532 type:complete len:55 (-) comp22567_c1_seq10:262-426(-)
MHRVCGAHEIVRVVTQNHVPQNTAVQTPVHMSMARHITTLCLLCPSYPSVHALT